MKRGRKIVLMRGPVFGVPVYATFKRSSDGDWTFHGKPVRWLHFHRSPNDGRARLWWLRLGEYMLMVGFGTPSALSQPHQTEGTSDA